MAHRDDLLKAFGLGPDDLAANRAGALSPLQARRLIRSGWNNVAAALVLGVGLAAILMFVADKPLKPVQWILASLFFIAVLITGLVYSRKVRAAAAAGVVTTLTGPVVTRMQKQAGWYLNVAGDTFKLPVRPWNVQSGQAYRVYVVPKARVVVAMEPEGWE